MYLENLRSYLFVSAVWYSVLRVLQLVWYSVLRVLQLVWYSVLRVLQLVSIKIKQTWYLKSNYVYKYV